MIKELAAAEIEPSTSARSRGNMISKVTPKEVALALSISDWSLNSLIFFSLSLCIFLQLIYALPSYGQLTEDSKLRRYGIYNKNQVKC